MEIQTLALLSSLGIPVILVVPVFLRWKLNLAFAAGPATCAALSSYVLFRTAMVLKLSFPLFVVLLSPIVATLFWSGILIFLLFFRDPERRPPDAPGFILSPADGTVIYIRPVEKGQVPIATKRNREIELKELRHPKNPIREGILIGIEMLLTDVHVNRAPISGRIVHQEYIHGQFHSLRDPESRAENERLYSVFQDSGIRIGVIQIASRRVRRILSFVQQEEGVHRGDRIGMIQFSSQVDVLIDQEADAQILIHEGDRVRAGETIIARLPQQS